jgi:hypothetical protein
MVYALDSNIVSYELKGLFGIREKLETAVGRGYTLVTHNTKHFQHISGLQIADWAE